MADLALKLALSPLLLAQTMHTRWRLPKLPEAAGSRQGVVTADGALAGAGRRWRGGWAWWCGGRSVPVRASPTSGPPACWLMPCWLMWRWW